MAGPLHFRSEDFKKKFLKKCSELGVILTGKIGREYLRGALAASSALVVSSVWETQCIVAYEAAAAGVSLCLSDIPTLKGAFGSLARYHQVGAYEKLADNLQDTLEGTPKGLKKKLKSFASKYSVENYEEGLKKIYTGTLDGEW
jgi:glycosyltransferase involved in cell wall biosynthesis